MSIPLLGAAAASFSILSTAAFAQENIAVGADRVLDPPAITDGFGWAAGISGTSYFNTSDDFSHEESELEGYLELTYGNFHTGLIVTSIYDDPDDDVEYEAQLGYGAEFGAGLSWDVTYSYIFLNNTSGHEDEISTSFGFPLGEKTQAAIEVIFDPNTGDSDQEFAFEREIADQWSIVGLVGNSDRDDNFYGEAGLVYAVTDQVSYQVLYEDADDSNGLLSFTVAFEIGS